MTQLAAIYPEKLGKACADLADQENRQKPGNRAPRAGNQDVRHENAPKQGVRVPSTIEGTLPEANQFRQDPIAEEPEVAEQAGRLADLAGNLPEKWDQAGLREIIDGSMKLLGMAGTMASAAAAYRRAFSQRFGNHLRAANLEHVQQALGADHFAYLKAVAEEGVHMGYTGQRQRRPGMMYASAKIHLDEALQQLWKEFRQ